MGTALCKARGRVETRGGGSETVGSARSCCNSVAGPSRAAADSDCAWACWALLPSRGQRGCFEPLGNDQGFGAHVSCPLNFIPISSPPKPHILDPRNAGFLASRAATLQLRSSPPLRSAGSQRRVRAQGGAGAWAENQSEGRTKAVGILDLRSLTRWNLWNPLEGTRSRSLGLRPGPGRERSGGSRVGAHTFRVPPEVPRLQRDLAGCFQFPFSLRGVLEPLANNSAPPRPPLAKRAPVVRT